MNNQKKVLIGMSGGVDSSVAAYLLKKDGYFVEGAIMSLTDDSVTEANIIDAKMVCEKIGINLRIINFQDLFKEKVITNFVEEYKKGRTPNPCVACNKYLKFGAMLDYATENGFDFIATGHYAKIPFNPETNKYSILISDAGAKDQSYMLYNHTQYTLSKTLMPLGNYNKDDVRKIASELELEAANRPDSQEICFIHDDDYVRFIKEYGTGYTPQKGNFVDVNGQKIGTHEGIINYTIGQRKGLGAFGRPMFVMKINAEKNQITLGEKGMEFGNELYADNLNFISGEIPTKPFECLAKNRYQAKPVPVSVSIENNIAHVIYNEPVRAITPGQSIVFYNDNELLGGGIVFD